MASTISTEQLWIYKVSLELKLARSYGVHFQDFFSTVMEKAHGADFIRVRPFGSLGDKGCDGYLKSNGSSYQCFGKLADAPVNVGKLIAKVEDDYALAAKNLADIMKEWHFAHNLVSGVPVELVQKIDGLAKSYQQHKFGLFGPPAIAKVVLNLGADDLLLLLGPAATAADSRNLRIEDVRNLVQDLMDKIQKPPALEMDIKPVPLEKLAFNNLPGHWVGLIKLGTQNAGYVEEYISRHRDPEVGERLARIFGDRYKALKLDGLNPGEIMDGLYELIVGVGVVTPQRQVAACALLAHLFESCDIFEKTPTAQ